MYNEHWKSIIEISTDIEDSESKVDIIAASYSILKSVESILKLVNKGKSCVNCDEDVFCWHPKTGEYKEPYVIDGDVYCYTCYNEKTCNEEEEEESDTDDYE